jgi:hypothetical protein
MGERKGEKEKQDLGGLHRKGLGTRFHRREESRTREEGRRRGITMKREKGLGKGKEPWG